MADKTVEDLLPDESLQKFMAAMRSFDQSFVDALISGVDFTYKLEVQGKDGKLKHARLDRQTWHRPDDIG